MNILKKMITMFLVMACCLSICTTSFATNEQTLLNSNESSSQTRVGIAGYYNYYHDGGSIRGSYTISTDSILLPRKKATIQLSDFDDDTWIIVEIYNSAGIVLHTLDVIGNGKWGNLSLNPLYYINGDTYKIVYQVFDSGTGGSDDGWIGIWFY